MGSKVEDTAGNSVGDKVGDRVGDTVGDIVGDKVGDTMGDIVGNKLKTRRRMARERRGAGSSLVSMETPY